MKIRMASLLISNSLLFCFFRPSVIKSSFLVSTHPDPFLFPLLQWWDLLSRLRLVLSWCHGNGHWGRGHCRSNLPVHNYDLANQDKARLGLKICGIHCFFDCENKKKSTTHSINWLTSYLFMLRRHLDDWRGKAFVLGKGNCRKT